MVNDSQGFKVVTLSRACYFNKLIIVFFDDILGEVEYKSLGYRWNNLELMSLIIKELPLCFLIAINCIELSPADGVPRSDESTERLFSPGSYYKPNSNRQHR